MYILILECATGVPLRVDEALEGTGGAVSAYHRIGEILGCRFIAKFVRSFKSL